MIDFRAMVLAPSFDWASLDEPCATVMPTVWEAFCTARKVEPYASELWTLRDVIAALNTRHSDKDHPARAG